MVELIYKAPLADIDAAMAAHVTFLKRHYDAGHFLISGRKIPRDGGIILAVAANRDQLDAIMREDPFCARGLADFRIVEFRASQRAGDIQQRIDAEARRPAKQRHKGSDVHQKGEGLMSEPHMRTPDVSDVELVRPPDTPVGGPPPARLPVWWFVAAGLIAVTVVGVYLATSRRTTAPAGTAVGKAGANTAADRPLG